ncbi:HPr family phosphocarrier protein [Gallaecimonas pentaromativorans]|uniref:Phosphocarrier protein HPr n=1 Tax=Gallaecimonas pentaromativorans TaxID=584787 RepID=A0A3N1PZB3_9GAMM|nr:HPr family phosphocarrier protein [Gallaecimonas pentaromativorans]MED5524155.1 HPr family phosphocarrier protein [Pseudomonadota bacterium]ROQ29916.1 phosphocarrier protein HPr [Gallaecimonas pentaromativorans]
MESCCITILAPHGLHTRPAALLVAMARRYGADITVKCGGLQASAKSLFALQKLPLVSGATIELCAEGDDACSAIKDLQQWLEQFNDGQH